MQASRPTTCLLSTWVVPLLPNHCHPCPSPHVLPLPMQIDTIVAVAGQMATLDQIVAAGKQVRRGAVCPSRGGHAGIWAGAGGTTGRACVRACCIQRTTHILDG